VKGHDGYTRIVQNSKEPLFRENRQFRISNGKFTANLPLFSIFNQNKKKERKAT